MPLTTETIDNSQNPLGEFLQAELRGSYEFMAASAFLNSGGLDLIEGDLRRILETEGRVSIVHGADFRIADPRAIRTLVNMKTRYPQMSYRVHCDWSLTHSQRFHPKLYIARKDRRTYCAAIGSSNLTLGGLRHNTEVNIVIRGKNSDAPIRDCLKIYDKIHDSPSLIEPNAAFADKYAALYGHAENLPLSDAPPSSEIKKLFDDLMTSAPSVGPVNLRASQAQTNYVVAALMRLGGDRGYVALRDIRYEAERLARSAGETYKWETFHKSVSSRLYDDVDERRCQLFEKHAEIRGLYRLSEKGRDHARRLIL